MAVKGNHNMDMAAGINLKGNHHNMILADTKVQFLRVSYSPSNDSHD